MNFKVILHLDHAPDYREGFLRELSKYINLVVIAHPCAPANLTPPKQRLGYRYYEINEKNLIDKLYPKSFLRILKKEKSDLLCIALNVRHPYRILTFLFYKKYRKKWLWWGQVLGRSKNPFLLKLKKYLIKKSRGALVYSEDIVKELGSKEVYSFNNSQFSENTYLPLENNFSNNLKCLFVGRPQKRKNLEALIELAQINSHLSFRLVGPRMLSYFKNYNLPKNIVLFEAASGKKLKEHFYWSNVVINPGHVGLLVMNAACHNRAIVINSTVNHAPEIILARESNQFLIDFTDLKEVSDFLIKLRDNPDLLLQKAQSLFNRGKEAYTIEYMAKTHREIFTQKLNT